MDEKWGPTNSFGFNGTLVPKWGPTWDIIFAGTLKLEIEKYAFVSGFGREHTDFIVVEKCISDTP